MLIVHALYAEHRVIAALTDALRLPSGRVPLMPPLPPPGASTVTGSLGIGAAPLESALALSSSKPGATALTGELEELVILAQALARVRQAMRAAPPARSRDWVAARQAAAPLAEAAAACELAEVQEECRAIMRHLEYRAACERLSEALANGGGEADTTDADGFVVPRDPTLLAATAVRAFALLARC